MIIYIILIYIYIIIILNLWLNRQIHHVQNMARLFYFWVVFFLLIWNIFQSVTRKILKDIFNKDTIMSLS